MGWTGSMLIGQRVHESMFRKAIGRLPREWNDVVFINIQDKEGMAWARAKDNKKSVL